MPSLSDVEKIINPADPSLTGLVPTGTTIANGLINNNAVGQATNAQVTGTQQGMSAVQGAGGYVNQAFQPYADAGAGALSQLSAGVAPGGGLTDPFKYDQTDFQNDPARIFAQSEGEKAINRGAAARGNWGNPSTVEALDKQNVGINNQYYGQDYTRAENTFNTNKNQRLQALQQLTNTGMQATQGQVQGQEWTATQLSDLMGQRADALAAGDIGKANSITQTLSGIAQQVSGNSALSKLAGVFNGGNSTSGSAAQALSQVAWPGAAAGAAGTAGALSSGAGAVGGLSSMAGTAAAVPGIASGVAPEALAPAIAGGGEVGGGGLLSSIGALATNPITIAAAGAIGIGLLAKHFFGNGGDRIAANQLTGPGGVHDFFNQASAAINQMPDGPEKQQAEDARDRSFENALVAFSKNSKDDYYQAKQTLEQFSHFTSVKPLLG